MVRICWAIALICTLGGPAFAAAAARPAAPRPVETARPVDAPRPEAKKEERKEGEGVHGHGHRILALVVALRWYLVLFHDRRGGLAHVHRLAYIMFRMPIQ